MEQKAYWVAFNLVTGIGVVRFQALIDYFGSLELAWEAGESELMAAGLSQRIIGGFVSSQSQTDPMGQYEGILGNGIPNIAKEDVEFPRKLLNIDQPLPVIYMRGSTKPEDYWAVAVAATRWAISSGRQVTEQVATYLTHNGMAAVSSLARWVDSVVHHSALAVGGRTIAVLGYGLDQIDPPEHRQLAEKNAENGAEQRSDRLIHQSAQPLLGLVNILESLNLRKVDYYKQATLLQPVDELESRQMAKFRLEPVHIDDIQSRVGYLEERVSTALTMMELKGMVRQVRRMTYLAIHDERETYRIGNG